MVQKRGYWLKYLCSHCDLHNVFVYLNSSSSLVILSKPLAPVLLSSALQFQSEVGSGGDNILMSFDEEYKEVIQGKVYGLVSLGVQKKNVDANT